MKDKALKSLKFASKIIVKNTQSKTPIFELNLEFGGRYIKAFDHIDGIDSHSHHILIYMGSRLPFNKKGFVDSSAWPSIGTIAKATHLSKATVRRKLHKLVGDRYLEVRENFIKNSLGKMEQTSNSYSLTPKAFWQYAIKQMNKKLETDLSEIEIARLKKEVSILETRLEKLESICITDRASQVNGRKGGRRPIYKASTPLQGETPTLSDNNPLGSFQGETRVGSEGNAPSINLQGHTYQPERLNPNYNSYIDNIHVNSSSGACAHVYETQFKAEGKDNIVTQINKRYAELFGDYAPASELYTFLLSFKDHTSSGKDEEERLKEKIFQDMQWVAERPHLLPYVRSLNFVWHMKRFRERERTMIKRTKPFVSDLIKEGKSPKDALMTVASCMNLEKQAFYEWGRKSIVLDLVK